MSRRLLAVLVAAAVVAVAVVWWTSDERQIRRRLAHIVELLEKEAQESELVALAAAREVANLFASDAVAIAEPVGARATDRQQLVALLHRYRSPASAIDIELEGLEIEVRENDTASSGFVARLTMDLGDRRGRESYRFRVDWIEEERGWLIHEAVLVEVLETSDRGLLRRWR